MLILAAITFAVTRRWTTTTAITITHHAFFLVVFYLYERVWTRIRRPMGTPRHVVKSLIYELVLGVGCGGAIVFFYTRSFPAITYVTGTYTAIKLVLYPIYDWAWPEYRRERSVASDHAAAASISY